MADQVDVSTIKIPEDEIPNETSLMGNERESIYESYRKAELPPEEEEKEEVAESSPEVEEKEEEAGSEEYEPETKDKEEKTVPLAALHEAREIQKQLRDENKQLKDQMNVLMADNLKILEKLAGNAPEAEDEEISDYDRAILDQRKEIKVLKEEINNLKAGVQTDVHERARKSLEDRLSKVNTELEAEGFKGFAQFKPMVVAKLHELNDRSLDNEEGWKKVFKEHVFPLVRDLAVTKKREETNQGKTDLKKKAGLASGPGRGANAPEPEKKGYTSADYLKMRNELFSRIS